MSRRGRITLVAAAAAFLFIAAGGAGADNPGAKPAGDAGGIESRRVFDGEGEDPESLASRPPYMDMVKLAAALGLVLGLAVAGAWGVKRFGPRSARIFGGEMIKVLARTYLGPRQMVCLVKVPGKLLVLGSTQQSVSTLAEIDDPARVEKVLAFFESRSPKGASETFRNILSGVTGCGGGGEEFEHDLARTVESMSQRVASLNSRLEAFDKR